MATSPITFTGVSRFSDDLQQILQRAVQIASLPIQRMQLDQTKILNQKTALGNLNSAVSALTASVADLGLLGSRGAVSAASSDPDVATVLLTGSPDALSYQISVTSAAASAQASTALALSDADAAAPRANGLYTLTAGAQTESFDLNAAGLGRTAGTAGSSTPASPVSVTVTFGNGLSGSITAALNSFLVGTSDVTGASAGDTVTVNFASADNSINTSITTDPLAGGEDAAALAAALNAQIALNADLNGKLSFSAAGGKLKLIESDAVGQGFTFTSSSSGTVTTGLEGGGSIGGHSAGEIAAALNAQVALDSTLSAAGVTFSAEGGEVKATAAGGQKFTFIAIDNGQGTGFASGLAGRTHVVGYGNSLNALRDYINLRQTVLGVRAAVINTSADPDNPRYDLTLTATSTGAQTLTLVDSSSADLLPAPDILGSNAVFSLNGSPSITNSSNTITGLVSGLDLTIRGAGDATITVAKDRSAVQAVLEDFVGKYNGAIQAVNQQIGESAGPLTGSIVVRQIHNALRQLTGYGIGSGEIRSMASLGLELSREGELSLNAATFNALSGTAFEDAVGFLGSTTAGFAGNAYSLLTQITDPATGAIQTTQEFFDASDERLTKAIADAQERVRLLTSSLQAQFTQSDSLLASLESQQNLLTSLFEEQRAIALSKL